MSSQPFHELLPNIIQREENELIRESLFEKTQITYDDDFFVDFDMKMGMNPISGDVSKKTTVDSVSQSIKNLILNKKFFKRMPVNFRQLLFENSNVPFLSSQLKSKIIDFLNRNEPRVNIDDVIIQLHSNNHSVTVDISFRLVTNLSMLYKFPIFINVR